MPREAEVIAGFTAGIISSPDVQDIPNDAASYSEDVDPESTEGMLRGRFGDSAVSGILGVRSGAFIQRDDGTHDLIYHDEVNDEFAYRQDFYGTPADGDFSADESPVDQEFTKITPFNREVRVGRSGGNVKWIGYIEEEQLGDAGDSTTLHCEDAELTNPAGVPLFTKLVSDSTHTYAMRHDGDTVYVIDRVSGDITEEITGPPFVRLRSITESTDGTKVWVHDLNNGTNGTIYFIDKSDYSVSAAFAIGAHAGTYSPPSNFLISDMIATDGGTDDVLWLAYHKPNMVAADVPGQQLLLFTVEPNVGTPGTLTPTDRTPKLNTGTTAGNYFALEYDEGTTTTTPGNPSYENYPEYLIAETFQSSLVKVSNDRIGWLRRIASYTEDIPGAWGIGRKQAGPLYRLSSGSPDYTTAGVALMLVTEGTAVETTAPIVNIQSTQNNPPGITGIACDYATLRYAHSMGAGVVEAYTINGTPSSSTAGTQHTLSSPEAVLLPQNVSLTGFFTDGSVYFTASYIEGFAGLLEAVSTFSNSSDFTTFFEGGVVALSLTNDTSGEFTDERTYFYKVSFTYDQVQESPLSVTYWTISNAAGQTYNKTVQIRIKFPSNLNRRISAINVYRASGSLNALNPDGFYRLVVTVPTTLASFGHTGDYYEHSYYDGAEDVGASYEARTGTAESLETNFVQYELSALTDGYLLIGKCRHDDLPDADHMIFKSSRFRFDSFDWSRYYLRLPEVPVAMADYRGKLYVASSTRVYKINIQGLFVEETYLGAGCNSPNGMVTTEEGIFMCDDNNVYVVDDAGLHYIGNAIKNTMTSGGIGWNDIDTSHFKPIAVYSHKLKQVHFIHNNDTEFGVRSFCYHIPYKRWDLWVFDDMPDTASTIDEENCVFAFTGKDGELYLSNSDGAVEVSGDSARLAFTWISKVFSAGIASQIKKFYKVQRNTSGEGVNSVITLSYSKDDGSFTNLSTDEVTAANRKANTFQIKAVTSGSSAGNVAVRALILLFRRMEGLR